MMRKGDFTRERDFPDNDKERVLYSIEIIHKVLVKRQGLLPVKDLVMRHGILPPEENSSAYQSWIKSSDPREYPLILFYYTNEPQELHYLWTAAILFGFDYELITCSSQKKPPDYQSDYQYYGAAAFQSFLGGGDVVDKKYLERIPSQKDISLKNTSLYCAVFKKYLLDSEFKWLDEERKKIQKEFEDIEKEIKEAKRREKEIEELNKKKERATERLMHTDWNDFSSRLSLMSDLDDGADINCRNNLGFTPLILCVECGNDAMAEFLLQQGADPLARTNEGRLASDFAIHSSPLYQLLKQKERAAILEKLPPRVRSSELLHDAMGTFEISCRKIDAFFEQGADVNYQDKDGFTVLMLAVDKDNERLAEYILRCGADPFLKNNKGMTARDYASRNSGIYGVLMGYELIFLTQCGNLRALQTLLCFDDTFVNFRCHRGCTALLTAVEKGFFEVVKLLLAKGADISMVRPDSLNVFDLVKDNEILRLLKIAAGEQGFELDGAESGIVSANNLINDADSSFSDQVLDEKRAIESVEQTGSQQSESEQFTY